MPKGIYKRKIGSFKKPKLSERMRGAGNPMFGKPSPMKGISRSQEIKDKIRKGHLGKKFTEEHRKNLSLAKKGKPNLKRRGENHPLWRGGSTPLRQKLRESLEFVNWRRAILERDNFTCQICNKRGGKLQVDHIKPFAVFIYSRFKLENGRTLCESCHRKTDTYGGRTFNFLRQFKGRKALITGITGQTGSFLTELLIHLGYEVHGIVRPASTFNRERIDHIFDTEEKRKKYLHYADVTDYDSLAWVIKKVQPDEIYNLAAMSHVGISWEMPIYTLEATGKSLLNLIQAVRLLDLKTKILHASTSELFSGKKSEIPQDENTPKNPASPYGTAKLFAYQTCKNYRDGRGMFICNSISFNHESKRRGDNFVTKKIINAIKEGKVHLGNVKARRDWSYAGDIVEGMWMILQQDKPDDYVLASGESHSVEEFIKWTEEASGVKLKVFHDKYYDRPQDVNFLQGNPSKAKKILGWEAKTKGKHLVKKML